MYLKANDIDFLRSIIHKLNEEEQAKLNIIINTNNEKRNEVIKSSVEGRKKSKYLSLMNKINANLTYNRKIKNFEKIEYFEKLKQETIEKHKKGEI